MTKQKYLKRVKLSDIQKCMDEIDPLIKEENYEGAFEILENSRIGPETMSPRGRTFGYILIEAQSNDRSRNEIDRQKFFTFFKLFLDKGGDLNHQDKYGITLLEWSLWKFCSDACLELLKRGANPNIHNIYKQTPLYYATVHSLGVYSGIKGEETYKIVVPALLKAGADPYYPFPTFEEAKDNDWFAWNLNDNKDGIEFINLYDELDKWRCKEGIPQDTRTLLELFFSSIEAVS